MTEQPFNLQTNGTLTLKPQPTLADLEAFCAEARRLGLGDNARASLARQGFLGPVIGLHFDVPVVPKGSQ